MSLVEREDGVSLETLSPAQRILHQVYEKFSSGQWRWIRGQMQDESGGYCLVGGIQAVASTTLDRLAATRLLQSAIAESYPRARSHQVERFNDASRSKERVLKVLRHAVFSNGEEVDDKK